jgi:hypothetical protein
MLHSKAVRTSGVARWYTYLRAKILNVPSVVAGLPDGIFSKQNSQFGYILEGLGMENVYFTAILNILRPF